MTTLQLNHTYLLKKDRYSNYGAIYKVTVIDITDTCYQFKYESGSTPWELKKEVDDKWEIIEDLGLTREAQIVLDIEKCKKELENLGIKAWQQFCTEAKR